MDENKELLTKWLQVLMYIALISLINSVVDYLPFVPADASLWISRGIMLSMVIATFQLAPVNRRYRTAAIMRAVMLGCALFTSFVFGSTLLSLAASIVSIISVYQEYSAHSELVADKDPKLSRKWHSLFNWSILAAVLVSFGSVVVVLLVTMSAMDTGIVTDLIVLLLGIPQLVIQVVYMVYLKKMVTIFAV